MSKRRSKRVARIELVLMIVVCTLIIGIKVMDRVEEAQALENGVLVIQADEEAMPATVTAYICGAVETPGTYTLEYGKRLSDLVDAAGGSMDAAALERVNLAEELKDGMKYLIPGGEMDIEKADANGITIEKFNVFTIRELTAIPGIGEKTAEKIVAYRNEHGSFTSYDELINVSGIGEKKLRELKKHISGQ